MGMRRVLVAGLAVVVSVSLVGCSEKDVKSEPLPTASVSESVVPKEESAEEFIRRWFQVNGAMQNTGNTADFLEISRGCEDCATIAARISQIYAAGGDVKYGGAEVVSTKSRQGSLSYDVRLESKPTWYRKEAGAERIRLEGGEETFVVSLTGSPGAWNVREFLGTSR